MNILRTIHTTMQTIGLTAALIAGIQSAHAQNLRLGHITPQSHVWHQVAEKIASDLDEASRGKMRVNVAPLQRLGNEAQMINLMQSGAMQMGIFTVAGLTNREESFLAWSLPYTFRDVEHATLAASTPAAREMLQRLEPHGMVGLGYAFAGMRHILSVTPVSTPADLANKKIRAFPSPIYNDWWNSNGAAPTALPLSEVAPSLTTKLLDAVDVDLDALVGMKFHHQAPNLTLTNHMAFPSVIAVSKRWWESLTESDREMVRKAVADAEVWGYQRAIEADRVNLDLAIAEGAKLIAPDVAQFEAHAQQVRDKYTRQNPLIDTFYQQAKKL